VVIARGALGNPWIFREASAFLQNGTLLQRPGMDEIADTMTSHLNLIVDFHGEYMGTLIFRKFFSWYCKGIHGIRDLKTKAFCASERAQMITTINEVREMHWDPGMPDSAESRMQMEE